MYAGQHKLTGLIGIIDYNKVQLSGTVSDTLDLEPLAQKWQAFGWTVLECDGHNIADVVQSIAKARELSSAGPVVLVAHTVKGKGVSFMEGKYEWHGQAPDDQQRKQALAEIDSCKQ